MKKAQATSDVGQASIIAIFTLSLIAVLIGLSLLTTGVRESFMGRASAQSLQAFYNAQSGVEEAFHKINNDPTYAAAFDPILPSGSVHVDVTGDTSQKTIQAIGTAGKYVRKIRSVVQNTIIEPKVKYAIHAGQGGIILRNNTKVQGKNNVDGDIFSNDSIKGAKDSHKCGDKNAVCSCENAASMVVGSAYAVGNIEKLENNDSGICVTKDAYAEKFNQCFILNKAHGPSGSLSLDCEAIGGFDEKTKPDEVPLPDMNINGFKKYMERRAVIFTGNCVADPTPGNIYDCTKGTGKIGNLIITGDFNKPSNRNLTLDGPVWVKGKAIFDSNGTINLDVEIKEISQMFVVDGSIKVDSNIQFGANGSAFIFFISLFNTVNPELCADPSITLSSNNMSVLFYSYYGCVLVTANSEFHGSIIGEKVRVENNSTVEFDPALESAKFGLSKGGGWLTVSFKEE